MTRKPKATSIDIAHRAGVSQATVDLPASGIDHVVPRAALRIEYVFIQPHLPPLRMSHAKKG